MSLAYPNMSADMSFRAFNAMKWRWIYLISFFSECPKHVEFKFSDKSYYFGLHDLYVYYLIKATLFMNLGYSIYDIFTTHYDTPTSKYPKIVPHTRHLTWDFTIHHGPDIQHLKHWKFDKVDEILL